MRVGVDATSWSNRRGYGRFTRELLRALAPAAAQHELICLLDRRSLADFDLTGPNVHPLVVEQRVSPTLAASADGARSPVDLLRMTHAAWRARFDVFFAPTVYTYFPLPPGLRAVVTIHDAIADRFPALTLPSLRSRWFWRAKVALGCWQARLIVTVSEFAAREVSDVLGVPRARIRVATEAPSRAYRPSDSREAIDRVAAALDVPPGAQWFLYVGGLNPHKHVEAIVAAHARVARRSPDRAPFLILVGPADDVFLTNRESVQAAIAAEGTTRLVRFAGFLPDEELRHLHSGAIALVLVSAGEGFGLPAVEAAACGTPVIATINSPLPELLRGGGLFVPPADPEATATAMQHLLDHPNERQALADMALSRARLLTWDHCARATLAALEEAAG